MAYLYDIEELRCGNCGWRVTVECYENLPPINQSPSYGPPGQAFIFDQGAIGNYLAIPIYENTIDEFIKAMFKKYNHQIFYGNLPEPFVEKPFDYKKRAAIEFDLGNESGLR